MDARRLAGPENLYLSRVSVPDSDLLLGFFEGGQGRQAK